MNTKTKLQSSTKSSAFRWRNSAILTIFLVSRGKRVDHRTFHQPQPTAFVRPKKRKKRSKK